MQLQGKVLNNMIKLVIKCRLLLLNEDNFFNFELESCGSVFVLSNQQFVIHFKLNFV